MFEKSRRTFTYLLEHQHRPNAATLIHAVLSVSTGLVLIDEYPEPGYDVKVYDGPKGALSFLPWDPIHVWGLLLVIFGLTVVVSGARTVTQFALIALAAIWTAFAASLLLVGITSQYAASFGGMLAAGVAAGAMRAALQFDRPGE